MGDLIHLARLVVLGLRVEVRSNHPLPARWIESAFRDDSDEPWEGGTHPHPLRLDIDVTPAATGAPRGSIAHFDLALPKLVGRFGRSVLDGDCDAGIFRIRIDEDDLADVDRLARTLLATPIFCTLDRRVATAFHSAGLVASGARRRAILVRAAADGGKSTLSCAWALRGEQVLSDESVWVSHAAGKALAGFGNEVEIMADAARFFPGVSFLPVTTPNGEPKLRMALPANAARSAPLAALVVLDRSEGEAAEVVPLSPEEALDRFWASTVAEEEPFDRRASRLRELLETIPAYRLATGGDPVVGAARLAELFDSIGR